jgi:ribosomal protein L37AE/L43A
LRDGASGKGESFWIRNPGGIMKDDFKDGDNQPVRVELKYCEHCGSLWVRERGAGVVYCDNCRPKVADLPIPKKQSGRIVLPVRPHTAVEDYEFEIDDDEETDFEAAAGGAA